MRLRAQYEEGEEEDEDEEEEDRIEALVSMRLRAAQAAIAVASGCFTKTTRYRHLPLRLFATACNGGNPDKCRLVL